MGGTGGGPQAVAAIIREYRRDEARRAQRREVRRAARAAVRQARAAGLVVHEDRWSFPCAQLCDGCGFLSWDAATGTSTPHRRAANTWPSGARCENCSTSAWIDLQHWPSADALLETEAYDAKARAKKFLSLATFGTAAALAGFAGWSAIAAGSLFGSLLSAGAFLSFTAITASESTRIPAQRTVPRRWSMKLPPIGARSPKASGAAVPQQELVAPLSGRKCVAYEVGVRYNAEPGAPLRTWALIEQRNVAFDIDGQSVGANSLYLELKRTALSVTERANEYLQARGLDPHNGELHVYETIVEPGDHLRIERTASGDLIARP